MAAIKYKDPTSGEWKYVGGGSGGVAAGGVTYFPNVSENGVLSWTNDGGLPNPSPINIKGAPGDDYVLTDADLQIIAELAAAKVKIPEYGGDYEVTPSASGDITLKTAQTFVTGDVVVKKISYRTEQNAAGGETVYIGGE